MDQNQGGQAPDRLTAQVFIPIMVEAFQTGLREAGGVSRWLLATLAAVNGAAAISMLPLRIATGLKIGAAGAFLLGILAALAAGIWSLYSFKRVSAAAHTMLGYWLTVASDTERLQALELTMKRDMDQAVGSRPTYYLLTASVAAFLVGCALTGWGMWSSGSLSPGDRATAQVLQSGGPE